MVGRLGLRIIESAAAPEGKPKRSADGWQSCDACLLKVSPPTDSPDKRALTWINRGRNQAAWPLPIVARVPRLACFPWLSVKPAADPCLSVCRAVLLGWSSSPFRMGHTLPPIDQGKPRSLGGVCPPRREQSKKGGSRRVSGVEWAVVARVTSVRRESRPREPGAAGRRSRQSVGWAFPRIDIAQPSGAAPQSPNLERQAQGVPTLFFELLVGSNGGPWLTFKGLTQLARSWDEERRSIIERHVISAGPFRPFFGSTLRIRCSAPEPEPGATSTRRPYAVF